MDLPKITDAAQLAALSVEAERRAALRYRQLAERAGREGRRELVELFAWLAEQERAHETKLRALSPSAESAAAAAEPEALRALGESARPEDEAARLAGMTLYAALAEAVRREDAAFALYSYLAAQAEDPAVQGLAEALAKEELDHAQLLRAARRKAYRRLESSGSEWPKASRINTLADLLGPALEREGAFLEGLPAGAEGPSERLRQLTRVALPELSGTSTASNATPETASTADLLEEAEAAFEFYDAVVERAPEPALMERAQGLSAMALERIKLLSRA